MLFSVFVESRRGLMRGAAIALTAGALAGCSSSISRFSGGIDEVFTGSTENQRAIIKGPNNQPFPSDPAVSSAPAQSVQNYPAPSSAAPVQRTALAPVSSSPLPSRQAVSDPTLPTVTQAALPRRQETLPAPEYASAPRPVFASRPDKTQDETRTASIASSTRSVRVVPLEKPSATTTGRSASDSEGWSRAGGSEISVKQGETISSLSRRYGVPSGVLMRANGLSKDSSLAAGQKIVIPTYGRVETAGDSSTATGSDVTSANSAGKTKSDADGSNPPSPTRAPDTKVAVLPQTPKAKEERADAQTASARSAPDQAGGAYTVQSGDSLYAIAKKTGTKVDALKAANGIGDASLKIGQKLIIPSGGSTVVAAAPTAKVDRVSTGPSSVSKSGVKVTEKVEAAAYTPPAGKAIAEAVDDSDATAPDSTGIGKMRWPVRGRVISNYRGGASDGIDIAVPEGTAVKAAENGVVIYAGDGLKEFGNTVLVRHEDGLVTVYGHASSLQVARGDKVKRGQEIARSGMTGKADTPKLHFEVRKDSTPVDPSTFLE